MKRASIYSGPVRMPKKAVGLFAPAASQGSSSSQASEPQLTMSQNSYVSEGTFASSQGSVMSSQGSLMNSQGPVLVAPPTEKPKPMAKLNKAIDDFVARKGPRLV
jgi:hypothetical protein